MTFPNKVRDHVDTSEGLKIFTSMIKAQVATYAHLIKTDVK